MTVRQIAACLEKHGLEDAQWEALLLAEHFTGRSRSLWRADMDTDIPAPALADAVKKRCTRYPLQYILGTWEFMGLPFVVREGCLIPRPDTEILAEAAVDAANTVLQKKGSVRVLDLCTGSGCILASVLHYCPAAVGTAVDLYPDALAVAEENFTRLNLRDRAVLLLGDVREDIFPKGTDFDLILSNPPYIPSAVIETLMPEVKDHEPMSALDGDEDGLAFYRRIIKEANKFLTENGQIFFEIGCEQGADVSALLLQNGFTDIRVLKDLAGLDRVVSATLAK